MNAFKDEPVGRPGDGTINEHARDLIRRDQDRLAVRGFLLAGASSTSAAPADAAYFDGLRKRVGQGKTPRP
ncbi:MAG: hypothetical protein RI920_904 [Pseudomonadota bacterium]|jgi:antitoxin ParD1/3/4